MFDFRTNDYKVKPVERNLTRLECIIKIKLYTLGLSFACKAVETKYDYKIISGNMY